MAIALTKLFICNHRCMCVTNYNLPENASAYDCYGETIAQIF